MKIMSDEKDKEKDTPSEPSTEETTPETVTEDVKKTGEEHMIPKSRLDKESKKRQEAEAQLEAIKAQVTPKQEEAPKESNVESRLEAVEFMAKHKEFDAEDYEAAHALAKGRGVSLDEAIKDPLFTSFSEKKANEKSVEDATPAGGRSPKSTPEKPLQEMTKGEHMKYFDKLVNG